MSTRRELAHPQKSRLCVGFFVAERRGSGGQCFFQHFLDFALLVHLDHDVGPADQFALDVQLREGRPVGVVLQVFEDFRVGQHVDGQEILYTASLQDLRSARREAALRKLWRAFHVQYDGIVGDLVTDAVEGGHAGSWEILEWNTRKLYAGSESSQAALGEPFS